MPIYEYQCEACGYKLEKLQKISDDPLKVCPSCGASKLSKLVSAAAFRLKGGGWYETDFKTTGRRNVSDSEKSKTSDSSEKSSTKESGGKKNDSKKSGDSSVKSE
ncbi:MAG: zinc ribbon domain-containing protein [Gammaproteobacteria bacterium TMED1]|nr:MAG: zinc ribbon domain-containing protein [Gammaproteobacteria bacterium TMED1]|tara:strand:- start:1499 stop:1813 length:315 start_codon:yes stop_codon:yes gene_type:complete